MPCLKAQAAVWFGRRDVGLSESEEAAFQQWLAKGFAQADAYREFEHIWGLLDEAVERPSARGRNSGGRLPSRRPLPVRLWTTTILAAAAALAVIFALGLGGTRATASYVIATQAGGLKKLDLPDGSVVRLNAHTEVEVQLTTRERSILLRRGEAFFEVAKDRSRPFVVHARGLFVQAVGTAFNVALNPGHIEVLVTEGKVRVHDQLNGLSALPSLPNGGIPYLTAGERAVLRPGGDSSQAPLATVSPVSDLDVEKTLAWRAKLLVFDNEPLAQVAAAFNRHNLHQLVIVDQELANRNFGGTLRADSYDVLIELLVGQFGVEAERDGDTTVLRVRR